MTILRDIESLLDEFDSDSRDVVECNLTVLYSHAIEIDYSNNGMIAAGIRLGSSLYPSFDAEIDLEYRPFRYHASGQPS